MPTCPRFLRNAALTIHRRRGNRPVEGQEHLNIATRRSPSSNKREPNDPGKACGMRDMAFHKKSGLSIEDMVRSRWVYRKLRNFRAGIEAGISCLKRAFTAWPAAPGAGSTT